MTNNDERKKDIKGMKIFLRIANIFIVLICILAICSYFILPLWKLSFNLNITDNIISYAEETIKTMTYGSTKESKSGNFKQLANEVDAFAAEALNDILMTLDSLKGQNLHFEFSLSLKTIDFLNTLIKDEKSTVQALISDKIEQVVNDLTINVKNSIKPIANAVLKTTIINQTKIALEDNELDTSVEHVMEVIDKAGINDEWLDNKTFELYETVKENEATPEGVTETLMNMVDEAVYKIADSGKIEIDTKVYQERKDEIEQSILDTLKNIATEQGNIDIDEFIATYLNEFIIDFTKPREDEETKVNDFKYLTADVTEEPILISPAPQESQNSSKELLRNNLTSFIMSQFDDNTLNIIIRILRITALILILVIFTWVYLIIKILVKSFMKKPGVTLWPPIVFGWLPFFVLVAIPTVLLGAGNYITKMYISRISFEGIKIPPELLDALHFNFFSGTFIAALCALILLIFAFIYGHQRRKLKRTLKAAN